MSTLKQTWRRKFIWCRGAMVQLMYEKPVSSSSNSFITAFGLMLLFFLVLAIVLSNK